MSHTRNLIRYANISQEIENFSEDAIILNDGNMERCFVSIIAIISLEFIAQQLHLSGIFTGQL